MRFIPITLTCPSKSNRSNQTTLTTTAEQLKSKRCGTGQPCNAINCLVFFAEIELQDVKAQSDNLKISNEGTVEASAQWDVGQELGRVWRQAEPVKLPLTVVCSVYSKALFQIWIIKFTEETPQCFVMAAGSEAFCFSFFVKIWRPNQSIMPNSGTVVNIKNYF